jgi:hypothetical protein
MGGDFVFGRIAQDTLDPVALADEIDEACMSSVEQGIARSIISILWRQFDSG